MVALKTKTAAEYYLSSGCFSVLELLYPEIRFGNVSDIAGT